MEWLIPAAAFLIVATSLHLLSIAMVAARVRAGRPCNVLMPRDSIARLLAAWRGDSGLVCSPPLGCAPDGFWAEIECAILNTYQGRWQCAADSVGFPRSGWRDGPARPSRVARQQHAHRREQAIHMTPTAKMYPAHSPSRRFRAIFLSDVHLGTRGCQAEKLLDFLRAYDAETIYLVGDIVDGWQLKSAWYWPQSHNDVVQKLLRKARKGTRIVYLPGNHDEFLRDYFGSHFGGIEVIASAVHMTANGKRLLVIHGDLFDVVIRHARWLAMLGSHAYDVAIWLNTHFNMMRRFLGLGYWSLSRWAKLRVKNAVSFIGEFENTLAGEARRHGLDGVVCGHIHHPALRVEADHIYVNCGDWVESCTAAVEHDDGRLEIIEWASCEAGAPDVVSPRVAAAHGDAATIGSELIK